MQISLSNAYVHKQAELCASMTVYFVQFTGSNLLWYPLLCMFVCVCVCVCCFVYTWEMEKEVSLPLLHHALCFIRQTASSLSRLTSNCISSHNCWVFTIYITTSLSIVWCVSQIVQKHFCKYFVFFAWIIKTLSWLSRMLQNFYVVADAFITQKQDVKRFLMQ